ncbi:MAG: CinA family protein, partial [Candidatus Hydrogenedentes bacterium]|nr:CinA family protein [Candidatus Hydrogenedentota bacterium]
ESHIQERLVRLGQTLATAESCSGGLIAHRLTNLPGSSEYFLGGIVAYSNAVKTALLGVGAALLERHGAVSEPVARQMAEGVRDRLGTDFGVGVTGIAGPGGGTPDKPVGLVYMAVACASGTWAGQHQFSGSREDVKSQAADAALRMLWERLA